MDPSMPPNATGGGVFRNTFRWTDRTIPNRATTIVVPPNTSRSFVGFFEEQQQQQQARRRRDGELPARPNGNGAVATPMQRSYALPMQTVNTADFANVFATKSLRVRFISVNSSARDRLRFPDASFFRFALPYVITSGVRLRLVSLEMPNVTLTVDRQNRMAYERASDALTRPLAVERGNYDAVTVFRALQRGIASGGDPTLRVEGTIDPVSQVTTLAFFQMRRLPPQPLQFVSPLRVQVELPRDAEIPQLEDEVLLTNVDSRDLPDGRYRIDAIVRAVVESEAEPRTFLRLTVPFESVQGLPLLSQAFGGGRVYAGFPVRVKLDLSDAATSLARTLGMPPERSSVAVVSSTQVYRLPLDGSFVATEDGRFAVFVRGFDIPPWFRGQHVVLREGQTATKMEVLESEELGVRVWLRPVGRSALPSGAEPPLLRPAAGTFRPANIRDVVFTRPGNVGLRADPGTIQAMDAEWISGPGTAYRIFVYTSDARNLVRGLYAVGNWPLPGAPASTVLVLCWTPVFRLRGAQGVAAILRFDVTEQFDNLAPLGRILFPALREPPMSLLLVSEDGGPRERPDVAAVVASQVVRMYAGGFFTYTVPLEEPVPSWVKTGATVSLRSSGVGCAFPARLEATGWELLESLGFMQIVSMQGHAIAILGDPGPALPGPPDPYPPDGPLRLPEPTALLATVPASDPVPLVPGGGEILTMVSPDNGLVFSVPVAPPQGNLLNNPFRNSAAVQIAGCPGVTLLAREAARPSFLSRLYDANDSSLYVGADASALSWGEMAQPAVLQPPPPPEALLPTLAVGVALFYLEPTAYTWHSDDDPDEPLLACVFLRPQPGILDIETLGRDAVLSSPATVPGRSGEPIPLSEFDHVVQADPSPRRPVQPVWLSRGPSPPRTDLPSLSIPTASALAPVPTDPMRLSVQSFGSAATIEASVPAGGPFCNFVQRVTVSRSDPAAGLLFLGADNFADAEEARGGSPFLVPASGSSYRPRGARLEHGLYPRGFVQLAGRNGVGSRDDAGFVQLASLAPSTASTDPDDAEIVRLFREAPRTGGGISHPDTRSLFWEHSEFSVARAASADVLPDVVLLIPNAVEVDVPAHGLNRIRCAKQHPHDPSRIVVFTALPHDLEPGAVTWLFLPHEVWDGQTGGYRPAARTEIRATVVEARRESRYLAVRPDDDGFRLPFALSFGLFGPGAEKVSFYDLAADLNAAAPDGFAYPAVSLAGVVDGQRLTVGMGDARLRRVADIANAGGSDVRVSHAKAGFRSRHDNIGVDGELLAVSRLDMAEYDYVYLVVRVPGYVGNQQLGIFSMTLQREEFILAKIVLTEPRAVLFNSFTAQDMIFLPVLAYLAELELRLLYPDGSEVDMRGEDFSAVIEIDELVDILSSESVIPEKPMPS